MADGGNFLTSIGLDPQLITAGTAGGLVKAVMGKQKIVDASASMLVGAMVSNYAGGPAVLILAGVEMFGMKLNLRPEVGGFFVGIFAFALVSYIAGKLRDKFGSGNGDVK